jgi:sulfur-carrier protein
MKVTFYATLRQIVGTRAVEFDLPENPNVQELIDEMIRRYPLLQQELYNDKGELYPHVHIFVNGRDAIYLENGLEYRLSPEDQVTVFPPVGGG